MDLGSLFLGLALLLLVALVVVRPLLDSRHPHTRQPGPAEALLAQREQILVQLRDLDFDHTLGKLGEDDYAAQRAQLVAQGVEALKQLDALGLSLPAASAAPASGDEIEAAIARRRHAGPTSAAAPAVSAVTPAAPAPVVCANCGRKATPGDQFCASCGQPLPTAGNPAQVQG